MWDHVTLRATDLEASARFYTAVAAGYRDDGAPGERPEYHAGYYGAFVLDPDGNNMRRCSTIAGSLGTNVGGGWG